MYNRYIPQPDGTYRRRPADVPQPQQPPRPEPPRQEPPRRNPDFSPPQPQGKPPCQKNPPCSNPRRQERPAPPPPRSPFHSALPLFRVGAGLRPRPLARICCPFQ